MKIQLSEHFSYSKLIKFTIPTIIMMIFTSIYGVVDGLFVSNCVGKDAFAAINLIMPALMIFGAIGFMIGTGGSALISKTLGEQRKDKANQYFSMLIYLIIILGIILSVIGYTFMENIAILLGADSSVLGYAVTYGRIIVLAITFFMLQNCFQSFLVVAEKPTFGLIITVIAGITNMVLDYLFIYVLNMNVLGAALATAISQITGAVIPLIYFAVNKKGTLKLQKAKFELKPILQTCWNGSSEMVSSLSMSLVNMLYNFQLLKYAGNNGIVAYGILMYIGFVFVSIYIGYSIGTAPIIGYNYGAKNRIELKNIFKKSLTLILSASFILSITAEILAPILGNIFVSYDEELLKLTINAIRIYSISYLMAGFNIFASSLFTALNNGLISAIMSFTRTLVFQISMIFILPIFWGLNGIWFAVVVADILSIIVNIAFVICKRKKYGYA